MNSTPENKTFPSIKVGYVSLFYATASESIPDLETKFTREFFRIQIVGFKGNAVIVVSCVTKDEPYRAHPHNLVGGKGKEGCKDGIYTVEINDGNMTADFPNLGIQCVKKKDIEEALKHREEIRVDPFRRNYHT